MQEHHEQAFMERGTPNEDAVGPPDVATVRAVERKKKRGAVADPGTQHEVNEFFVLHETQVIKPRNTKLRIDLARIDLARIDLSVDSTSDDDTKADAGEGEVHRWGGKNPG